MPEPLFKTIITTIITAIIGMIVKYISISKMKEWWKNTRIYGFLNKYWAVKVIKSNQKIFNAFILLNKSNADPTKTKCQKNLLSIQHLLHKAVVSEMELWVVIKSNTNSPKEREIINELLPINSNETTVNFSKRKLKTVGKRRLKCCKNYIKALRKYQRIPIENYQAAKLNYLNDYVKSTKSYYELLYIYLPIEQRNILEKPFHNQF